MFLFLYCFFKHVHYRVTQRDTSDTFCQLCCGSMEAALDPRFAEIRLSMPCLAQSAWSKRWSLENEDINGGKPEE